MEGRRTLGALGLVTAIALVMAVVFAPAADAVSPDPNPWLQKRFLVMAHQGGEDEAPSNTMFSVSWALIPAWPSTEKTPASTPGPNMFQIEWFQQFLKPTQYDMVRKCPEAQEPNPLYMPPANGTVAAEVYLAGGRIPTGRDAVEWAVEAESRGAGEILLTSMDRDGTRAGFDCPLTAAVAKAVNIPVIASGGAGTGDAGPFGRIRGRIAKPRLWPD